MDSALKEATCIGTGGSSLLLVVFGGDRFSSREVDLALVDEVFYVVWRRFVAGHFWRRWI